MSCLQFKSNKKDLIMYKVTLIEGKNDISFTFKTIQSASSFIDSALDHHMIKETENGTIELVIEIEAIKDDF